MLSYVSACQTVARQSASISLHSAHLAVGVSHWLLVRRRPRVNGRRRTSINCLHPPAFSRHQRNPGPAKCDYICLWLYRRTEVSLGRPTPLLTRQEQPLLIAHYVVIMDAVALLCNTCFLHAARILTFRLWWITLHLPQMLSSSSVRRYSANTWTRGAVKEHCSFTPLQIMLEIRCWTIQYRTIIEKWILQPIINFQK